MTRCPRLARNATKRPVPAGGVQCYAGLPAAEVLGHDRLVSGEQPAARFGVIAGGLLLAADDGADPLGEYALASAARTVQAVHPCAESQRGSQGSDLREICVRGGT